MSDIVTTETDRVEYLDDEVSDEQELSLRNVFVSELKAKFEEAKRSRQPKEYVWMLAYNNFKGRYGSDTQFTESEKSRAFIKITKTKTVAAFGSILDVVFSGDALPITVEATKDPVGIEEVVHIEENPDQEQPQEEQGSVLGFPGDDKSLKPGETLTQRVGHIFANIIPDGMKVKSGSSSNPKDVDLRPAEEAAKRMNKRIHDQMEETDLEAHISRGILGMCLYGTGIVKGPFAYDKEYPRWLEDGTYDPIKKTVPRSSYVPVWAFYPDPSASTPSEMDYAFERHRMSRTKLRALKNRPYFRRDTINRILDGTYTTGNYVPEWWENQLDDEDTDTDFVNSFEVLEFWGSAEIKHLEDEGIEIPESLEDEEEVEVNAWICGDELIRLVLNPYKPSRKPYHRFCYEEDPHNFWGIGVPENMEDSQLLMNGFMRMAVDNAVLSGNLIIEIDETNLVPGQSMEVYAGKTFRRSGGPPGQAIFGTKYPNTAQENMLMYDKARQLADEATGIPSFAHGQTGVSGMGRTAAGMSMLFGAAGLSTKTVIKNLDRDLFKPLGEAYFAFNMQFNFDPTIKGDLEVRARGTTSLMRKEVKSQRLLQFVQISANSPLAPFIDFTTILKDLAHSLELDPDRVINDPEKSKLQALIMGTMGQAAAAAGSGNGSQNNPQAAGNLGDPTGGGGANIGVGSSPSGDEEGGQPQEGNMMNAQ